MLEYRFIVSSTALGRVLGGFWEGFPMWRCEPYSQVTRDIRQTSIQQVSSCKQPFFIWQQCLFSASDDTVFVSDESAISICTYKNDIWIWHLKFLLCNVNTVTAKVYSSKMIKFKRRWIHAELDDQLRFIIVVSSGLVFVTLFPPSNSITSKAKRLFTRHLGPHWKDKIVVKKTTDPLEVIWAHLWRRTSFARKVTTRAV